jgi:hypothetical protein
MLPLSKALNADIGKTNLGRCGEFLGLRDVFPTKYGKKRGNPGSGVWTETYTTPSNTNTQLI